MALTGRGKKAAKAAKVTETLPDAPSPPMIDEGFLAPLKRQLAMLEKDNRTLQSVVKRMQSAVENNTEAKLEAARTLSCNPATNPFSRNPDNFHYGDPARWQLICKAWNTKEGWMRSTKAYNVSGLGVLVQVSTIQNGAVAEEVTFVPGAVVAGEPGDLRIEKMP